MMYPYITLRDDTEITHSEMKADGRVKVYSISMKSWRLVVLVLLTFIVPFSRSYADKPEHLCCSEVNYFIKETNVPDEYIVVTVLYDNTYITRAYAFHNSDDLKDIFDIIEMLHFAYEYSNELMIDYLSLLLADIPIHYDCHVYKNLTLCSQYENNTVIRRWRH